jgi:hypothetical protein
VDVTSFLRAFHTIMNLDYGVVNKVVLIATYICSTACMKAYHTQMLSLSDNYRKLSTINKVKIISGCDVILESFKQLWI